MIETLIVGSGFSALCSYLILKDFNTKILSFSKIKYPPSFLNYRKNLNINKVFSPKGLSLGSINYDLGKKIILHDRLIHGGNTNIWGGFIDISDINIEYIKLLKEFSINFNKLDLSSNGYKSNNSQIRQLRDNNGRILNSQFFFNNYINGFLHSFKFKKDKIIVKIFSEKDDSFFFPRY